MYGEAGEVKTKEVENILKHEIDNWIRWGRKRDWMPSSFKSQMGALYRSIDGLEAEPAPVRIPVYESVAVKMERIVVNLPDRHRQAFVMHHLDRAAANGMIRIVRNRDEKARLLCVGKSRYHEIVGQAHNIVLREWMK